MKEVKRKGFTIVELVIVIAVIAILAAVLIPTFSGIIRKADVSNDTQIIRNANSALKADLRRHETMSDALEAAQSFGLDISTINAKADGNEILWDSANDVFCYYDADKRAVQYIPETDVSKSPAETDLWKIVDITAQNPGETTGGKKWSLYARSTTVNNVTVSSGFDVGKCDFDAITYSNTGAAQEVVIRTGSYDTALTINAENDAVRHFGRAKEVDVRAIAMRSYHEFGDILGQIHLTKGSVSLAEGCKASAVVIDMTSADLSNVTTISADNSKATYVPIILNTTMTAWRENAHNALIDPEKNHIIYTKPDSNSVVVKEEGMEEANIEDAVAFAEKANRYYMSIDTAINSAGENEYILLLKDGQIYHNLKNDPSKDTVNTIANGVTIDLNGHSLKWQKGAWLTGGENVTIKNGSLGGVTDTQSYSCFFGDDEHTSVLLSNLESAGGFNFYNTTATIVACNVALNAGYNALWVDGDSDVTVESGTFDGRNRTTGNGVIGCSDSLLKIKGGTFLSNHPEILLSTSEYQEGEYKSGLKGIIVTGGSFNVNIADFTFVLTGEDGSAKRNQKLLQEGYTLHKVNDLWVVSKK